MIDVTVPFEMPQMVANKYLLTAKYPERACQDRSHTRDTRVETDDTRADRTPTRATARVQTHARAGQDEVAARRCQLALQRNAKRPVVGAEGANDGPYAGELPRCAARSQTTGRAQGGDGGRLGCVRAGVHSRNRAACGRPSPRAAPAAPVPPPVLLLQPMRPLECGRWVGGKASPPRRLAASPTQSTCAEHGHGENSSAREVRAEHAAAAACRQSACGGTPKRERSTGRAAVRGGSGGHQGIRSARAMRTDRLPSPRSAVRRQPASQQPAGASPDARPEYGRGRARAGKQGV